MSKKYIFSREKLLKTPEGIFTKVQDRAWPKWCDGKEATFDPKLLGSRGVVAAKGTEFSVYRDWCDEIEVSTRTRTRWTFSRDKWAEDLAQLSDSQSFPARRWPKIIDGCVAWFDTDTGDDLGTVYGPDGATYEVHRSWCIAEEVAADVRIQGN